MAEHILVNTNERILELKIHRPDKKNALTQAMYEKMARALEVAEQNHEIRVVLIRGTEDCFTGGNDIADFLAISTELSASETLPARMFMEVLRNMGKPVIAAVNGFAVGIGTTLLLHCDLVYAARNTRFQLPFLKLGLCPEFASSYLLPLLMGRCKASELLFLGEVFDADKAYEFGLINAVFENEVLYQEVYQRAQMLAELPPNAMRVTKSLIKNGAEKTVGKVIDDEMENFFSLLKAPEAKEALLAFMQKRKPDFSGFG